jgi:hypothetical protein
MEKIQQFGELLVLNSKIFGSGSIHTDTRKSIFLNNQATKFLLLSIEKLSTQPFFFILESCVSVTWVRIGLSDFHHQATWDRFPTHFGSGSAVNKKKQVSVSYKSKRLGQKLVMILSGSISMC